MVIFNSILSVSALEFSFSASNKIIPMQDFEIDISKTDTESYDVKIFFQHDSTVLQSEIETLDGWKNTYYYLKSSYPEQQTYKVRLKPVPAQEAKLCVRLRKPNQTYYEDQCKDIEVIEKEKIEEIQVENQKTPPKENIVQTVKNIENEEKLIMEKIEKPISEEPIILRAPQKLEIQTTQGKTRIIINYVLAFIVIIALFLVIKRNNSEF